MGQDQSTPALPPPPTASPAPTITNVACQIDVGIDCFVLDDKGRLDQECDDLVDPRTVVCTDDLPATGLAFRYLGNNENNNLPNQVFITVGGGRTETVFAQVVQKDEIFRADGDFRGTAAIEVSAVNADGSRGERLLSPLEVNTECETGDTLLTLTTTIGPFELVGFHHALGYRTSVADLQIQYYLANDAPVDMYGTSAVIASPFLRDGPLDALEAGERFYEKNNQPLFFPITLSLYDLVYTEDVSQVDLGQKYANGETFTFTMQAMGRAKQSGVTCETQGDFSF